MKHVKLMPLWLLLFAVLAWGCGSSGSKTPDPYTPHPGDTVELGNFFIVESEMSAQMSGDGLSVMMTLHQKTEKTADAVMRIRLLDLNGEEQAAQEVGLTLSALEQDSEVVLTDLPEGFASADRAKYIIRYEIELPGGQIKGTRSLHAMYRYVQAQLLGTRNLFEGGASWYKLIVNEPNSGAPVEGATGVFKIEQGDKLVEVGRGTTDDFGMADVRIDLPEDMNGDADLKVMIDMPGGEQQEQAIAPVLVSREAKILLTTDKPLYQPGQTIHMRALALKRPDLLPQAGLPVSFVVIDPKGNKVMREEMVSSAFGVAAVDFKLASLVNEGSYTLQASVGEFTQEKTVTVERYALPKFKVAFSADRSYYQPGQHLVATVNADYFFGKKVSGSISVVGRRFDVEMETFFELSGAPLVDGQYTFELDLPSYFLGSAVDEDKAYAFFEITVTDSAGHTQVKNAQVLVVEKPILVSVVPESGSVVPFVPNSFYLISTDPFGRPVKADCSVALGQDSRTLDTGGWGLTTFEFTPEEGSVSIAVDCVTGNGDRLQKTFDFAAETEREYVLLRTDKSMYKVGDTIQVSLFVTNDGWEAAHLPDRVYLDVIKSGQTMLMTTVSLTDGKGAHAIDIDPTLSGSIELMAYYLGAAGEIIRDRRLVFVELANTLTVEITPSKDTFLPAEEATIDFAVRDHENNGVASVLGVQVVDEAVFALQDMKPGMEKVYFALEEELLQPRYEIHGFDATEILDPPPENPEDAEEREAYAGAFLAAAGTDAAYGTHVNTFSGVADAALGTSKARVKKDLDELIAHVQWMIEAGFLAGESSIDAWIKEQQNEGIYDAWGQKMRLEYADYQLTLSSSGLDELRGTDDDLQVSGYVDIWGRDGEWQDDAEGGGPPNAGAEDGDMSAADGDYNEPGDPGSEKGEDGGPRIRSYFPETLYVNPALITDDNGQASVSFDMADSITSWRMTALASSLKGQIGSNVSNVIVFQDFFIDIDFPATLTQNDVVHVPIAIYNYLQTQQTISLSAEAGDWLEFLDGRTRQVTVGPNSVSAIYFPVRVTKVGWHDFQVVGEGDQMSDGIRRKVEVVPDGLETRDAISGRLDGEKNLTLTIPENAIANASKMWVKIYPGLFSQVVEGLDSMLQMPSGCFEQTSSATYPNILVLDYMVLTDQVTPELELKARDYISQGYQRLLSYEVDGGGFEWFGQAPAHRVLTAYGLLEFSDMAKVHDVDPAVISRTQDWLIGLQNGDGSWDFDAGGIHEGATNNFTNSVLRTTAYIAYALAESGYSGSAVSQAVNWVKTHISEASDNYTLGLVAMFLSTVGESGPALTGVLDELWANRIEAEEGGAIHWDQEAATEMYGEGNSAQLETTALIGQAFIRANYRLPYVPNIMDWLVSQKGSFGEWSTTQGTIQALRFMIATLGTQVEESDASITISANGTSVDAVTVNAANSDVLQLRDLTSLIVDGENSVTIGITGTGNLMYSLVYSYWTPGEANPYDPNGGPLSIAIAYDKTQLEVDDIVTATLTLTNNTQDVARMVLVDIGMPPGFDLISDMLSEQIQTTALQRFELAGRQLILYIERIDPGTPLVLTYQMRARFPMEGSSGSASVANYYKPEDKSTAGPVAFVVTE